MKTLFKTFTGRKIITWSKVILCISLFTATLSGCKDKDDDPPAEDNKPVDKTDLTFKFNTMTGAYFISDAGDTIRVTKLKFIMSDFVLEKTNGDLIKLENDYGFLSLTEKIDSFVLKDVPTGDYKSIGFMVGVDQTTNHGDPLQWSNEHPLNPSVNDMYWGWAGGYIFNVVEGYYKNMGVDKAMSFHIALDKNTRSHKLATNYTISKNNRFTLYVETEKFFSNVVDFSLKTDGDFSHSSDPDPVMDKFIQNVGVFTVIEFK